jgi:hypothetical protein
MLNALEERKGQANEADFGRADLGLAFETARGAIIS